MPVTIEALGILVLDEQGRLKTDKIGSRTPGKGAAIGLVLAMLTPVGLAVGVIGGGVLGHLHHKDLGLSNEVRERIGAELQGGKAAVGVMSDPTGSEAIAIRLADLGGTLELHGLDADAVSRIAGEAPPTPADDDANPFRHPAEPVADSPVPSPEPAADQA